MGTRNLIGVRQNKEWKVAQYCQWDGYPSGQGTSVLKFCKNENFQMFRQKVEKCFFLTKEEEEAAWAPYSSAEGWMTGEQSAAFARSKYWYLTRDTGAKILDLILESEEPLGLSDQSSFLQDGLFCEWAYVLDLDRDMLQVYKGFSHTAETNTDSVTIGLLPYISSGIRYYVNLLKEYSLNALPTKEQFLKDLGKPDEDDEEEESVAVES